eukprot:gene3205-3482_t
MDSSDIMSDPGTVPGGGFGLAGFEGASGFTARMKPGRNRFMPHHHLGTGGYYGGVVGRGFQPDSSQGILMEHLANAGAVNMAGKRTAGSSADGGGRSARDDGSSSRRGGSNARRGSKGSLDFTPRSPQLQGAAGPAGGGSGSGSSRRSLDSRGWGGYAAEGGRGGGSATGARQTPLPSPGGRSGSGRGTGSSTLDYSAAATSPHLAGSSSGGSTLTGHPSPLLLPEPALPPGGGSHSSSMQHIPVMPDLPAAAANLPLNAAAPDLERFLAAASPTVPINPATPLQQLLESLTLRSVWDLFLEPSIWGTPVPTLGGPRGPSTAYYVPYMLVDLHPASWFCLAWYPVYRIPDAPLTARFLAFYSFSQLLEMLNEAVSSAQTDLTAPCRLAGLPVPVVGLKWYNLMGERWLELLVQGVAGTAGGSAGDSGSPQHGGRTEGADPPGAKGAAALALRLPVFQQQGLRAGTITWDLVPKNYPLEEHKVYTEDGWVLRMHRIPRGGIRHTNPGPRPVVLLFHGLTLSSASFALFNPNESLAYILADAGFDVWMANSRSNDYSRGNLHYNFRDPEYWYTSMDEIALIDLPAMVNTILKTTGAKKMGFVGHSQGAAVAYAMAAELPAMGDKLTVIISMGPSIFLDYMRAPFLKRMAEVRNDKILELMGIGEFIPSRWTLLWGDQCADYPVTEACVVFITIIFFGPSTLIPTDDYSVVFATWPSTVSSRNMIHVAQWLTDSRLRFQKYDFGTDCSNRTLWHETCNQQKYGTLEPPEYDLSQVKVPVFIMQGGNDIMVTEQDVQEQMRRLPNAQVLMYQHYSHMDFVWDRNAHHAADMVDLLYRYSPGSF